jgi:hypothetical protein
MRICCSIASTRPLSSTCSTLRGVRTLKHPRPIFGDPSLGREVVQRSGRLSVHQAYRLLIWTIIVSTTIDNIKSDH